MYGRRVWGRGEIIMIIIDTQHGTMRVGRPVLIYECRQCRTLPNSTDADIAVMSKIV